MGLTKDQARWTTLLIGWAVLFLIHLALVGLSASTANVAGVAINAVGMMWTAYNWLETKDKLWESAIDSDEQSESPT